MTEKIPFHAHTWPAIHRHDDGEFATVTCTCGRSSVVGASAASWVAESHWRTHQDPSRFAR